MNKIRLRPFPAKYRAALALGNDTDDMTLEKHRKILAIFSSLGLKYADSFWFFSDGPKSDFTYFDGMRTDSHRYRDEILEGISDGTIDTLHSWGNFPGGTFRRNHAQQALEEINSRKIKVSVCTPHGAHGNSHNILCQGAYGDVGGHEQYTCDILKKLGVAFVWNYELSPVPGQSAAVSDTDYFRFSRRSPHVWAASYLTYAAHKMTGLELLFRASSKFCSPPLPNNDLLSPVTARDGNCFVQFKRYGIWLFRGANSFVRLFSEESLNRLLNCGGMSILYAHLARMNFDRLELGRLERIAKLQADRKLFVASTSELLTRAAYAMFLQPEVEFHGKKAVIRIPNKITSSGLSLDVRTDWVSEAIDFPFPGMQVEIVRV